VLPLSSWAEYTDRFVNLEGKAQIFEKAIKPVGHSRPAYDIVNSIARELKNPLFESKENLQKDIDALLAFDSADEPEMKPVEVKYAEDKKTPGFDIPMLVVDQLHHFGHWTEKSHSLSEFCNEAFLEMSPALAEKLKVEDGTIVRVESEVARINLPVKISEIIDSNVVLAYRNFATSPVNNLQMRKRRIDWVKIARVEGS
jgi:predicted molibdopterin-dependent oxidoreductase YjgC